VPKSNPVPLSYRSMALWRGRRPFTRRVCPPRSRCPRTQDAGHGKAVRSRDRKPPVAFPTRPVVSSPVAGQRCTP
jgi:hypothetical protein